MKIDILPPNVPRFEPPYREGLSASQVEARQKQRLVNKHDAKITKSAGRIVYEKVFTFFNLFNLAIGACITLVGEYENLLFLLVVFFNTLIGIVQELNAKRMVDKLSLITLPKATVIRGKREQELHFDDLVLDDIMLLSASRQIGADSVVVHGSVEVNEALLTGESDAILKREGDSLLSGSFVVSGSCHARVEHIGAQNYAVGIASEAKTHKRFHSKLLDSLNAIIRFTSYFVIPIGLLMFAFVYFGQREGLNTAVVSTAAALIGMLPNGLMLLTSVSLSVGVMRLGKRRALVQQLFGIETLSRVDVLCLDKTGTITQGRMRVEEIVPLNEALLPVPVDEAMSAFVCAMDDNNATFMAIRERFPANGNHSVTGRVPFSSERKWSAAAFGDLGTIVVGAPDVLLESVPEELQEHERAGARVVLVALSDLPCDALPGLLQPVAALVLNDPVRESAALTLAYFERQGVAVKIISGDNPQTVSSIAKSAGFTDCAAVDAQTLSSDGDFERAAEEYAIFGRVKPAQKRQLIRALKKRHTVAMIGDGVNDVLALREADCSVAMAAGSEAARQISQLVLLDSDFAALPSVVNEGRRVVNNITRTASLYLLKTGYSFLLSFLSIALGLPYPFIPIQLTLIGMYTQGIPSFFLALEPNSDRIEGDFFGTVLGNFLPSALVVVLNVAFIYLIAPYAGLSAYAGTLCVLATATCGFLLLLKVSLPLNKLRLSLLITVSLGFFACAWAFRELFSLALLSWPAALVYAGMALLCYPLTLLFSLLVKRLPFISKLSRSMDRSIKA